MQVWSQKYKKIEQIGQGASGLIVKVLNKQTNQTFAAKIIKSSSDPADLQAIQLQVKIMTTCLHNNIITCAGVQVFADEVWILMEYCSGGSLADIMRSRESTFQEDQIASIMEQVLEGLKYLHKRKIVHRDIKASNLLVHKGTVKIGDFGVSLQNQKNVTESKFSRIGSPFWMSPEILSQSLYTEKGDVWALGITAIELAEGQPPYSHQHPFRAIYSIQTHPPKGLQYPEKWSKQFCSFVNYCLSVDFKSRPSVEDLLSHCFISKKVHFSPNQSSLYECQIEQVPSDQQNTIIMHEQVPKSVWEKHSNPQTQNKLLEEVPQYFNDDTVVINQNVSDNIFLFSELKKNAEESIVISKKEAKQKQNMISNEQVSLSVGEKEKKVKQLYRMMQEDINRIRKQYMSQIRSIYLPEGEKEEKRWESPVKKLKERNKTILSNDSFLLSSEIYKKML